MNEIPELRTTHTKTYDLGDGQRRVVGGSKRLHYEDNNGSLKEITANATETDTEIRFEERPQDIWIEKDPFCGVLHIDGDGYEITISISPFVDEINDTVQNEAHRLDSVSSEKTQSKETVTNGFDFTYDVDDEIIDIGAEFTRFEIIPNKFAFHIEASGVTIEESDERHEVYEVKDNNNQEKVSDHPQSILFTDSTSDVLHGLREPVFLGVNEDRASAFKIESQSDTTMTGYFETPAHGWMETIIEKTGSLVMDPSVESGWNYVSNGTTQNHTPPDSNISISNEQVRWEGVNDTRNKTKTEYVGGKQAFEPEAQSMTTTVQSPNELSDSDIEEVDRLNTQLLLRSGTATAIVDASWGVYDSETSDDPVYASTFDGGPTSSVIGQTVSHSWEGTTASEIIFSTEGRYHWSTVENTTIYKGSVTNTYITTNPSVDINSSTYSPSSSELNDGEQSSFVSVSGAFTDSENTLNHSIDGSYKAKFKYEYDYTYLPPDPPTNLSAEVPNV